MSNAFVIEVGDQTVGIVVRQDGDRGFRFHSALRSVDALEGQVFATPRAAEAAARIQHFGGRRRAA